jgi:hypothetical protein
VPVYSHRFLMMAASTQTQRIDYVVPTGKRAIVKGVSAYNGGAVAGGIAMFVGSVPVWFKLIGANNGEAIGGQMLVVNSGESLGLQAVASISGQCSGYLLDV